MICKIKKWILADAADLAAALSNRKMQDNLREGLPSPYSEQDGQILFLPCCLRMKMKSLLNKASCRVLEKAGFQYEGTLRNNAVKNGKIILLLQ